MNRLLRISALFLVAVSLVASCGGKSETRPFPMIKVPVMYNDNAQGLDYCLNHYWDAFLDIRQSYPCDSVTVNGVTAEALSNATVTYSQMLLAASLDDARRYLLGTLAKLEKFQEAYPESNVFAEVTKLLCSLEYDPNSPVRDEDIYGPFAGALSRSAYCPEDLRVSHAGEEKKCSLNSRGTRASDFEYIDTEGKTGTLYGTKAEILVLNFINPGCHACEEVVAAFKEPAFVRLLESGKVAVLGMYIDEEIDKWFESRTELPSEWICGYDPYQVIRGEELYDVRAIPSIYVLDKDKKVLLKDAPVDRTLNFLQNILL